MEEIRKKICFITTISTTLEIFVLETAKYLYKNGNYDITFICNSDKEFEKQLPNYINFIPIKMKRGMSLVGIKAMCKLYKIFREQKFDLIQYSTPNASLYASIVGRLAKIKVRLYCQWGIRYVGFLGIKRKIFKLIEKIICKNSTWIEPDSYGNLKFSHQEQLYTKENSSVIWNGSAKGVDLEKFNIKNKEKWNIEIRKKYKIDLNDIIIGFVGRLNRDKGINELVQAFKEVEKDNLKLLIVGPNDKCKKINEELYHWTQNNPSVIFTGKINEVEKYYATMDIFILPSYREGFGSVIIEAEAMGVPIIVSDIPGPTDAMVKNETGLVVKKADVETLKNAIQKLVLNKSKREYMGSKGVKFASENFEQSILFKHILEDRKRLMNL